ncbi:GIY-YIG nuclease family protein [Clostridium gasigenes]|uniref:GIY-YIG nuclease family protein n=1 Tax=Clostridium gasigenes TaxID=94869 RepID=A0A7X0SD00_9CLOT|nr:GIY-YIG nuclease family protein [Clostridium gasigenes]MBB6715385.1 GIY-YIG nuclease family protein [Clostridium gasigenes]MBU3133548.1 GIY-YIG nuclease family protein [Clostridium gasigenes]
MNYMYILKCSDSSLYTGWTNDLDKRFKVHSQGKGAKYTKGRLPVELVYFEEFDNKIEAMKREYEVKQLSRKEKQKLIIENGYKKKIDKKSESNIIEL